MLVNADTLEQEDSTSFGPPDQLSLLYVLPVPALVPDWHDCDITVKLTVDSSKGNKDKDEDALLP